MSFEAISGLPPMPWLAALLEVRPLSEKDPSKTVARERHRTGEVKDLISMEHLQPEILGGRDGRDAPSRLRELSSMEL